MKNYRLLLFIGCCLLLLTTTVAPSTAETTVDEPPAPALYDPNVLDWGIYWFGTGNVSQKAGPGNPYFDPAKPTMIFVHGWQPDTLGNRNTLNYIDNDPSNGVNVNMGDAWIADGWNIGIFFWNQLADEGGEVKDAEAKIWTPTGPQGMRWRLPNGSYSTVGSPNVSAGELFYDSYVDAMQGYTGNNVRLIGHSLGNQMATRLTHLVTQNIDSGNIPANLMPKRVVLADPFWSRDPKGYLNNQWVGEVARDIIGNELLPKGVMFEWYRSSAITGDISGDANDPLKPMIHYADMRPQFCGTFDQGCKHSAAWHLYIWSYAFGPTPEVECSSWNWLGACNGYTPTGFAGGLAQTSDSRLWDMMVSDHVWDHVEGMGNQTPNNDTYEQNDEPGQPFAITLSASKSQEMVGNYVDITADVDKNNGSAVDQNTVSGYTTDLGWVTNVFSITQGTTGIAGTDISSATPGFATITGTAGSSDNVVVEFVAPCQTSMGSMTVTGTAGVSDLSWSWADAGAHDVWHSTAPYFFPGDGQGTRLSGNAVNSYIDTGAVGDPAMNHFYLVRRIGACSSRIGEFDFSITPGA